MSDENENYNWYMTAPIPEQIAGWKEQAKMEFLRYLVDGHRVAAASRYLRKFMGTKKDGKWPSAPTVSGKQRYYISLEWQAYTHLHYVLPQICVRWTR